MTDTLYLDVSVYPLPYGGSVTLYADIWLASVFLTPPAGSSVPPVATPAGTATVAVAFGGTAATITGLDNTKSYWLRLFNPQGYQHWFPVGWSAGASSGHPLVLNVPALEGPTNQYPPGSGPIGGAGPTGATGATGGAGGTGGPGACGVSGVVGACGVSGVSGVSGTAGAAGACGVSGTAGAAGACGVSGTVGGTGGSGGAGACGVSGTAGAAGACGVSGTAGTNGAAGACGVSGTAGTNGAAGACGVSGVSGVSGVTGVPGACGVSGVAGGTGGSGGAGACGVSGTAGTAGACGVSGVRGACGVSGTAGACGVSGTAGSAGGAGACGVSGVSGVTGSGIAVATDPLFGTTAVSVTTTAVSTSATASIAGECVVVTVGNIAATAQFAANASVRVRNTTSGIMTGWQSAGLLFVGQIATQYHNIPVAVGDTVVVDIIAPGTITASKTTISAVLTTTEMSVELRSDGRGMPLGTQWVGANVGVTVTLIAAQVGWRVLIKQVSGYVYGLAGNGGNVSGTLNGGPFYLLQLATSVYQSGELSWENGILCDPDTALFASGSVLSGDNISWEVIYDIVPL